MKANEILRQAADVIEERGKLRDTPDGERSMARAVAAFNTLVGGDRRLTELEGWLFMSVLKLARATAGSPHIDDMVDLSGYAALAAECMQRGGPEPGELKPGAVYFVDDGDLPFVTPHKQHVCGPICWKFGCQKNAR